MGFQFHISDVSFDNAICAQSIVYPNNKCQLKMIKATRSPSTSSIICTGVPNMVFHLMKKSNLCTDKTNGTVTKIK